MDKAGKERKPWISGLFDYRVTPQSHSIASPLQLMTQHTPREKNLPQLPSVLGAPEMHQTHQELIKRQGNKPERKYQELVPGTPVWMQHKHNTTWEPAIVVNQCTPNSYWIMQENSAELSKVYRCTRTVKNSQEHSSTSSLTLSLPTLDLPESENFSENREESQVAEPFCTSGTTVGNASDAPNAPVQ